MKGDHGMDCWFSRDAAEVTQSTSRQGPGPYEVLTVRAILDSLPCGVDLAWGQHLAR